MSEDMNPPTKGKDKKAPAKKTAAKKPESGEKKARAPRKDWGFRKGATITVDTEKEHKFRGQKLEWFERLKKSNGKTCQHFIDGNQGVTNAKGNPEPPRGWLRAFVTEGYATLAGGEEEVEEKKTGTNG